MASPEMDEFAARIDQTTFDLGRHEPPAHPVELRSIVVGIDGSKHAQRALDWAASLTHLYGAKLTVASIVPPSAAFYPYGADGMALSLFLQAAEQAGQELLDEAVNRLSKEGLHPDKVLDVAPPARALVEIAAKRHADLLVVGSRGHGGLAALGSVAEGVKNHAECSVLLVRNEPHVRRILAAVDGSTMSKSAALTGDELARRWQVPITALHVVKPYALGPVPPAWQPPTDDSLPPSTSGISYESLPGDPATRILERARDTASDLLCMGSRGLGGIHSLVAGSVSSRVAHNADATVLLVKQPPSPHQAPT